MKFPWMLRPLLPQPETAFAMAFFSMLLKNRSNAARRFALIVERLPSSWICVSRRWISTISLSPASFSLFAQAVQPWSVSVYPAGHSQTPVDGLYSANQSLQVTKITNCHSQIIFFPVNLLDHCRFPLPSICSSFSSTKEPKKILCRLGRKWELFCVASFLDRLPNYHRAKTSNCQLLRDKFQELTSRKNKIFERIWNLRKIQNRILARQNSLMS